MDEPGNGESMTIPHTLDAPRSMGRSAPSNDLNAFMGPGCIYEGKLTFEGRVRIDGKFTGEIFSTDTLEIGPKAEVEAEIDVSCVIIAGSVNGDINARGRCDLRAPGVIVGNIRSPVVTMEEGVRFDGAMQMHHVLEEAVRASTQRAPSALESLDRLDEDDLSGVATGRIEAPATRDPSDLLDPENI
jgi:cytoskeletal protein CcmA (bactofilin family)